MAYSFIPGDEPFIISHLIAAIVDGPVGHPIQAWVGEEQTVHRRTLA